MNEFFKMPKPLKCIKCGHEWYPRIIKGIPRAPRICPTCKVIYWDKPRPLCNDKWNIYLRKYLHNKREEA